MPGRAWDFEGYAERQIEGLYAKACIETDRLIALRGEPNALRLAKFASESLLEGAIIRAQAREDSWADVCEKLGINISRRNSDTQAS